MAAPIAQRSAHAQQVIFWRHGRMCGTGNQAQGTGFVRLKICCAGLLIAASPLVWADTGLQTAVEAYLARGDTTAFEHLGRGLRAALAERRAGVSACRWREAAGDIRPLGDGRATHHALLSCPALPELGIRFSRIGRARYRILGYWTTRH